MDRVKGLVLGVLAVSLCACHGGNSSSGSTGKDGTRFYNLEPLSAFSGLSDWSMAGGSPAHSGYAPVTLDAASFTPRWSVDLGSGACGTDFAYSCTTFSPAVTDAADGRVILDSDTVVQTANVDSNDIALVGLNESDGSVVWTQSDFNLDDDNEDFHSNEFSNPTVFDGKVYVSYYVEIFQQGDVFPPQPPVLEAFDAKDGAKVFSVNPPCASPCASYDVTQSMVADSILYSSDLDAYDPGTGRFMWASGFTGADDLTAGPGALYYADAGTSQPAFGALDPASGASLFQSPSTAEPGNATAPILDGRGGAVVGRLGAAKGSLDHYSLTAHAEDWSVTGRFSQVSKIAVAGGVVYACDGAAVTAYAVSDGSKLWSWTGDSSLQATASGRGNCSLLVTNNLLFVSSLQTTYAVDLTTHQPVWTYPEGGFLSLSPSGLLYISVNELPDPATGANPTPTHLVAINLH